VFLCPDELEKYLISMHNICIMRAYRDFHKVGAASTCWAAASAAEDLQNSYWLLKVSGRTIANWKNRWDLCFVSEGGVEERCVTVELLSSSLGCSPGALGSWKEGLGERSCLIYVKYV